MPNSLIRIAVCALLAVIIQGCSKKVVESSTSSASAMQVQCKSDSVTYAKTIVDTTVNERGETVYTEIVFIADTVFASEAVIGTDGTIKVSGGIQSVRQWSHSTESVNVGKSEEEKVSVVTRNDSVAVIAEHRQVIKEKAQKNSDRWKHMWRIAAIGVAVAIVFVLLYRKRIIGWMADFFARLARNRK